MGGAASGNVGRPASSAVAQLADQDRAGTSAPMSLTGRGAVSHALRVDRPALEPGSGSLCPAPAMSWLGGTPNLRAYSRLNWLELSYPTSNAAVVTEARPVLRSRRASSRRSSFWYCRGVVEVVRLKCWWKDDALMPTRR